MILLLKIAVFLIGKSAFFSYSMTALFFCLVDKSWKKQLLMILRRDRATALAFYTLKIRD